MNIFLMPIIYQILLGTFTYLTSFNPHCNSLKYLLFCLHFINEETVSERISNLTRISGNGDRV